MPSNKSTSGATAMPRAAKKVAVTAKTAAQSAALTLDLTDIDRLALALALAAADEAEENPRFAQRVRANYEALPPTKPRGARNTTTPKALTATLIPIKRVEGGEINPTAPIDPELVLEVYGPHQFRQALDLYSPAMLREGAAALAIRLHVAKPPAKASKARLIDFVATSLIGEGEA